MANSSLTNPNQRGLWGSGTKQMDAWDFSVSYPHPPSLSFWICLENSKSFKQNHHVTRNNTLKSKPKESLCCPWLLFLYQHSLDWYFLNKEEQSFMPPLCMLPALLVRSFPMEGLSFARTPRTVVYSAKAGLCSWGQGVFRRGEEISNFTL